MILVFGQTGQVATELGRHAGVACIGRDIANLERPEECATAISRYNPSAVINAAAYTNVDEAEKEYERAQIINAEAPKVMAESCAALDIPFVQISSDYVFDGSGNCSRNPEEPPAPLNAYGKSKLQGELAVQRAATRFAVLRTSWVFSPHGKNFVKTMLRLGATQERLEVVSDQVGGPTSARDIARACLHLVDALISSRASSGVYHFAGAPATSWSGFSSEILSQAGLPTRIDEISSDAFPTLAQRPKNSRLNCSKIEALGIMQPDWRHGLTDVLKELGAIQ